MAKYDNTGDVKRRRFPFFLTIFIIGIVLFIVGVVLIKVTNTKSLGKRYSYNETFDVAAIDKYGDRLLRRGSPHQKEQ